MDALLNPRYQTRKKTYKLIRWFCIALASCLTFCCSFFAFDQYNLKILFLTLSLISGCRAFLATGRSSELKSILAIGIIFPIYLALISCLDNHDLISAVRRSYCAVYFLIISVLIYYKIDYEKIMVLAVKVIVVMTVANVFLDIINICDIFENPLLNFLYKINELAVATKGNIYKTYYKLYLKGAPLILLLCCYSFYKKKYVWWFLSGVSCFFTGSSAILFVFVYCTGMMMIDRYGKIRLAKIFIVMSIILCNAFLFSAFFLHGNDMEIRQSIIQAYIRELRMNPLYLFFGMGCNTPIYIKARDSFEVATEWSYFEFIRNYGLIGFIPLMYIIFKPIIYLASTQRRWVVYALLGYLVVSFTNPLLYTSTAMVAYVLLYYEYFISRKEKLDVRCKKNSEFYKENRN